MIAHHYPHSGWIRLHEDTLAALRSLAARRGHLTHGRPASLDLLGEAR